MKFWVVSPHTDNIRELDESELQHLRNEWMKVQYFDTRQEAFDYCVERAASEFLSLTERLKVARRRFRNCERRAKRESTR